jgi:hypothetical protein
VTASLRPAATATATLELPSPATSTVTPLPSETPGSSKPPEITYFGVARADDFIELPDFIDAEGRSVFLRPQPQAMTLVLEARPGTYRLGDDAYDGEGLPSAQFLVSRPLGDGSVAVCDTTEPLIGGVPGFDPPVFSGDPALVDAVNDLGCRVNDGTGAPLGRSGRNACTKDLGAEYGFVDTRSNLQFCLPIARAWSFPPGDTIVAARVRDVRGNVSAPREIVVHVPGGAPSECGEEGIGEHTFTVDRSASTLGTSVQPGDLSLGWSIDPIRICAGPDIGGGIHDLALRADAVFGLRLINDATLCIQLSADGSDGRLDCSGTSAQDVRIVQKADGSPLQTETGLGVAAGTGAASLRIPLTIRQLPVGSSTDDCRTATGGFAFVGALTTATGTAVVLDAAGHPTAQLSLDGANFDCRAWRADHRAALVLPLPVSDTSVGDIAAALLLHE